MAMLMKINFNILISILWPIANNPIESASVVTSKPFKLTLESTHTMFSEFIYFQFSQHIKILFVIPCHTV